MRKLLIFCLTILITLTFLGCNESTSKSKDDDIDKLLEELQKEFSENYYQDKDFVEQVMHEHGATMYAKEVEFDMANNLDKKFFIQGIAQLSNYYNYGYSNKYRDRYFCIRVSPKFDTAVNDWYLYCSRDYSSKLYDALLSEGTLYIYAICFISSLDYVEGQDNQAKILSAYW